MSQVAIIIPSWNNPQYLYPCVDSVIRYTVPNDLFKIYIVNNGDPEHVTSFMNDSRVQVLQMKSNVGWEGGLQAGIENSTEPYLLFLNDDTMIPSHQRSWLQKLVDNFSDPVCAAVGPTSNVVMGKQNMFVPYSDETMVAKFLIGFCMLVRRDALLESGGIDRTLPGGDDLDLSIRLRKMGKSLVIDRDVFVYHHGFKTGERIEGGPNVNGGWNSIQRIEKTNFALINKHGLKSFLDLWQAV